MKNHKIIIIITLVGFIFSTTSCFVGVRGHGGGGKKGWTKNSNNPHHPATTNPGHTKGKGKGKH